MKICSKCELEKELSEFHKKKSSKDGHKSICKDCSSKYKRKYYKRNKEKIINQVNRYHETYDNKLIEKECRYSNCNNKAYLTKYELKTKKEKYCSTECRDLARRKSPFNSHITNIKKRVNKKKFEFNLTEEYLEQLYIEQNKKCAISNVPIKVLHRRETTLINSASIDRIDNSKGYIKGNVQWVMLGINYMKLNFPEIELHKVLKDIQENYMSP